MRKRDKLSRLFRGGGALDTPLSALNSMPPSTDLSVSNELPAVAPAIVGTNPSLELAIQKHLDSLPVTDKEVFRAEAMKLDQQNLLSKVKAYDDIHKQSSSFRPRAENISKFLKLLNRCMAGISTAIQANPDPSSIIVGAVQLTISIALEFANFFDRLAEMVDCFADYLGVLAEYSTTSHDVDLIRVTVASVYGDLLRFFSAARRVFVDNRGVRRKWVSIRAFLQVQWEPFETTFGKIDASFKHHLDVLMHAAGASQLRSLREAEIERTLTQREELLNWISRIDFEKRHEDIHSAKMTGTGTWLLEASQYKSWLAKPSSALLWCHGKPGAGKSVLMSNVLEHVTAQYGLRKDIGIAFTYYDYQMSELGDASSIISALLKQLCRKKDSMSMELLKFKQDSLRPSFESLKEIFISFTSRLNETFLIIDALDECPTDKRHLIIGFIRKAMEHVPRLKVFITSRPESDIMEAFVPEKTLIIKIEDENVNGDIGTYIRSEVSRLRMGYNGRKLHIKSDDLEETVIEKLIQKAEGMFLWVNLQLDSLLKISKAKQDRLVESALATMPRGLHDTYRRIFLQIDAQEDYMKSIAFKSFAWVLFSKTSLRIKELQAAILAPELQDAAEAEATIDVDVILDSCANLLVVEDGIIRPIHYSVYETLTSQGSDAVRGISLKPLHDAAVIHEKLGLTCLLYLQTHLLHERPCTHWWDLSGRLNNNALLWYCSRYFDHHIYDLKNPNKITTQAVETLLSQDTSLLTAMMQIRKLRTGEFPSVHDDFRKILFPADANTILYSTKLHDIEVFNQRLSISQIPIYALHNAAASGSITAVTTLIESGCDIQERDETGTTPLCYTALEGQKMSLKALIGNGAHIDARSAIYGTALQAAAFRGHKAIVETLLENGANVNAQGGEYGNALQAAATRGHVEVVMALLEKGADVNAQGDHFGNALQAAALEGHGEIVMALLEKGADVNAQGGYYGNALQAAIYGGHVEAVMALLEKGANVNAQGGYYGNALQAAAIWGHVEVVMALIEKGANVNAQGGHYGNALQAAAYRGRVKVVIALLEKGANVNAQGGHYGNALQAAAYRGRVEIVMALLEKGANVNAQGGYYGNALYAATTKGHVEVVMTLLEKGANVNAQGGEYGNALQAAIYGGHVEAVMALLEKGANVNAQGGYYGNALQAAAIGGHVEVVMALLEKGAHVNAQGGKYGNALYAAATKGRVEVVMTLLEKGAHVNAQGGHFGNALQAAALGGHIEIAMALFEKGANVNAQGGEYGNALQAAIRGRKPEVVKVLLDHGADVNAVGTFPNNRNALEAAKDSGNKEIIQLLLEAGATDPPESSDALSQSNSESESESESGTSTQTWHKTLPGFPQAERRSF